MPDAVMVVPERVIATSFVEEMGEDSSLWTGPEAGEGDGKKDCISEQPLTAMNNASIASILEMTRMFFRTIAPAY
jgi:hypothetical protein